ncbi:MAG: helix-turn-helix domain-containing protein [Chloroflexi bacterium]|nr:helix-turn-helix domain-containing protein [Chloroflexota bacterium]
MTSVRAQLQPTLAADRAAPIDPTILDGTALHGLPATTAEALLATASVLEVRAGQQIFGGDDEWTHVGILIEGSARTYLTAADGRQLTVRYGRPGSLTSRRAAIADGFAPLRIKAVTACRVLELEYRDLLGLAASVPAVGLALVDELSARLMDVYLTVADTAFGSMRQRVARHLLALADANAASNGRPVANVSQQQLADGIGSSREAVARMLSVLREEGLIHTAPREIELLEPRRLRSFLGEWQTEGYRIEPDLSFDAERLLQASPNAILVVDRDGAVVFANRSAERVFGWSVTELIGRPVEVLVPDRLRFGHADHRAHFLEAPRARAMGLGLELRGRRQDGSEFPMTASLTTIDTRDGALVIATVVELEDAPLST